MAGAAATLPEEKGALSSPSGTCKFPRALTHTCFDHTLNPLQPNAIFYKSKEADDGKE